MHCWPLAFHQDVAEAIGRIRRHLSPRRPPKNLHHYTSLDGALGIIDSRALWATRVEDLEDPSEIRHGVEMVRAEVQRRQELGLPRFPEQVLRFLSEVLIARRVWTFVACFRSKLAEKERGPYCLEFETLSDWEPRLRLSELHADVQYHRVIYQPSEKRKAIHCAIGSIVIAAARNSRGGPQGPWAESLARIYARIASQSLMNLIASFKCCIYEWEDEWRIVCGPRYSQNLAPDMDDDRFEPLIKPRAAAFVHEGGHKESKRYVELRLPHQQRGVIVAFPSSEIPFNRIYYRSDTEHQRIRHALRGTGRPDVEILEHP